MINYETQLIRNQEVGGEIFPGRSNGEKEIWRCPTKEEKEIALIRNELQFLNVPKAPPITTRVVNVPQAIEVMGGTDDSSLWLAVSQLRRAEMAIQ